jgi:DNA replicative helicase MCM subunit Mcm2 (Cdc46/Mcm family)
MSTATEELGLDVDADAYRILLHSSDDFVEAMFRIAEESARRRDDRVVRMVDVRAAARHLIESLTSVPQHTGTDIEGIIRVLQKIEADAHE